MTWCEKIDLEKMDTLRRGSPWSSDPILIKRREKMAAFFAGYANTKNLSEGDTYSDAEDYEPEDEEDGEDGEYETESDVEAEQGDGGETREVETEGSPQLDAEVTADVASTSQIGRASCRERV